MSDVVSSHHNNQMFRMTRGTPFNSHHGMPSAALTNSNNQNIAFSGSNSSGQALLPGKGTPNTSGGGWYWPTLAQELDALKDTRESNSQQALKDSNTSLSARSPHNKANNGTSRPSRTALGGVLASTMPSPRTLGSNGVDSGGPNMLMHVSPGAGPPGGIPIAGTGDGFSNVFSGGVVSMAQSHHWGNTVGINSTARLGGVGGVGGLSGAPGMGPSDDSAAHYVHIELDHSDGEGSQKALSKAPGKTAAAVSVAEVNNAKRDAGKVRSTATEIEAATVADAFRKEHSADHSTAAPSPKEGSAADSSPATAPSLQQAESALNAAPATPEPAQVMAAPAMTRGMHAGAEDSNLSHQSPPRHDSLSPMHSAHTSQRGPSGRSLTESISKAVADGRPRGSHHRNHSGTAHLTSSSDLVDCSQVRVSRQPQ